MDLYILHFEVELQEKVMHFLGCGFEFTPIFSAHGAQSARANIFYCSCSSPRCIAKSCLTEAPPAPHLFFSWGLIRTCSHCCHRKCQSLKLAPSWWPSCPGGGIEFILLINKPGRKKKSPSERDYPFRSVRTTLISPARFDSQNAPGRFGCLCVLFFSFFLFSPRCQFHSLSSLTYLAPRLVLSPCCWREHKPQCFFLLIPFFFDDVSLIHLASHRTVFLGLGAAAHASREKKNKIKVHSSCKTGVVSV